MFLEIRITIFLFLARARVRSTGHATTTFAISWLHLSLSLSLCSSFPLTFLSFQSSSCASLPWNADGYLAPLPPPFIRESLLLVFSWHRAVPTIRLPHHYESCSALRIRSHNSQDNRTGWVLHPPIRPPLFPRPPVRYHIAIESRYLNLTQLTG